MELLKKLADLFLHLDTHLSQVIAQYGAGTYLILFLIIFCETGLVVTPFLPGDSLLFAAGAFAALGALDVRRWSPLLIVAAVLGERSITGSGAAIGPKAFDGEPASCARNTWTARTPSTRHGGKTIILARFVPIVRTFAPFVAGVGTMSYRAVPHL